MDKEQAKLKSLSLFLDLLVALKVLRFPTWYQAHGMKWNLLGKPEWSTKKVLK